MKIIFFFQNGRIDITVQKAIVEKYKWRSRHRISQLGYFLQGPTTTHEKEKKKSLEGLVFFFFSFNCVDVRHISPGISLMSFLDRKEKSSRIGKTLGKETLVKCCGCSCCCWSGLAVFVVV